MIKSVPRFLSIEVMPQAISSYFFQPNLQLVSKSVSKLFLKAGSFKTMSPNSLNQIQINLYNENLGIKT